MLLGLDLNHDGPMDPIGRVVALLEGLSPGDQIGAPLAGTKLDDVIVHPAEGLPIALRQFGRRGEEDDVVALLARLPSTLPRGPVPVIDRGPCWLGYHHQRAHDAAESRAAPQLSPDQLRENGRTLFGPDHRQAEMARALGLGDSSRIRGWPSDDPAKRRRVPVGVRADLLARLRRKSGEARELAEEIARDGERAAVEGASDGEPDEPRPLTLTAGSAMQRR